MTASPGSGSLRSCCVTSARPGLPAIPGLSSFPETNVRTYVVDRAGLDGLWFLSLDVSGLATVLGARAALWLPYHWAAMTVKTGSTITYRSRRRWPPTAGHNIVVEPGSPLPAEEVHARGDCHTER